MTFSSFLQLEFFNQHWWWHIYRPRQTRPTVIIFLMGSIQLAPVGLSMENLQWSLLVKEITLISSNDFTHSVWFQLFYLPPPLRQWHLQLFIGRKKWLYLQESYKKCCFIILAVFISPVLSLQISLFDCQYAIWWYGELFPLRMLELVGR